MLNLMLNFITEIFTVEFLSNFKVIELEFEPGDLRGNRGIFPTLHSIYAQNIFADPYTSM
jgi:hypothetical protein